MLKDNKALQYVALAVIALAIGWISLSERPTLPVGTVVPEAYAAKFGAEDWSQAKRQAFLEHPENQWSFTEAHLEARQARGPEHWLPPESQCLYLSRFVATINHFDLRVGDRELERLAAQRQRCYTQFQ